MAEFIPRAPLPQQQIMGGQGARNTVRVDDSGGRAIAGALSQVTDAATGYARRQAEQEDAAALLKARRELSDWENTTFDPGNENGIGKYRGLNALGANDALLPDLDKRVSEIGERLNPRQRQQFEGVAINFRDGIGTRLNGYMDREHTSARRAESEAAIGSLARDAATAGMNGDIGRQEELLAEAQVANGVRFSAEGQGESVIAASNRAMVSSVRRQTIESVAATDPFKAQEMVGEYRDQLDPEDRAKVESVLYPVIEDAQATERFDAWVGGSPGANPNAYRDPGARGKPSPEVKSALDAAADANGVPREYLYALTEQESSFNPKAVGPETEWGTAKGMLQYLDMTAGEQGIDAFDIKAAANAAARQFKSRMDQHGPEYAIAAHFGGDGGADAVINRGRAAQNPRTALYVQEVMGRAQRWRGGPVSGQDAPLPANAGPRTKSEAMEYARSIRNPNERQAFTRKANEYFALEDQRQSEAQKAWSERINTAMQTADATQSLPSILGVEDYSVAVREGKVPALESLRLHQIQGTFVQDDLPFKETLAREAVTDPDAFMRRDFNDPAVRSKLATDSLDRFVTMQKEAAKPGKRDEWASESQLLGQAYTEIGLVGGGENNAKKRDEFERAFLREKRAWNEAHGGRNPSAGEMQSIINGLKLPMIRERWWSNSEQRLYQAGKGYNVPATERVQIIEGLRAAGYDNPSEAQVVEAYRKGSGDTL